MAKKLALDLIELDRLKGLQIVNELELAKYKELTVSLQQQSQDKTAQISLLRKNVNSLETELEAEKKKKKMPFLDKLLYGLGIFAVGVLAGSL